VSCISAPVSDTHRLCHSTIYNQVCLLSLPTCVVNPAELRLLTYLHLPLGPHGIAMLGDSKSRTSSATCTYRVSDVAVSTLNSSFSAAACSALSSAAAWTRSPAFWCPCLWRTRTKSCSCQNGEASIFLRHNCPSPLRCATAATRSLLVLGFSKLTSSFLTWPTSWRSFDKSCFLSLHPCKQANACCAVLARRAKILYIHTDVSTDAQTDAAKLVGCWRAPIHS